MGQASGGGPQEAGAALDPEWRDFLANHSHAEPDVAFAWLLRFATEAARRLGVQAERIAELERASRTDELTGLLNRRGFSESLGRELASAARHGESGFLVYLDVDGLKEVNDRFGHDVGDAVLRHVATTLVRHVRPSDHVARLHGDEFSVLLTRAAAGSASRHVRALTGLIERSPLEHRGAPLPVRVSAGFARYDRDTDGVALLRRADHAMYRRKRASRGRDAAKADGA